MPFSKYISKENIKKVFGFIIPFFSEFVSHASCCYKSYRKQLGLSMMIKDLAAVFKNVTVFFIMNLIVFILFVNLPEGRDVLLVVAEDMHDSIIWPFIFLLFGLAFWAISSEFAARYIIYVSDNSGWTLTDYQVEWRKLVQKLCSFLFLLLPFFIVAYSIIIIYIRDYKAGDNELTLSITIIAISIYAVYRVLAVYYFNIKWRERIKKWGSLGRLLILDDDQKKWLEKLYGIYNPYTYSLPNKENFSGNIRNQYEQFADNFLSNNQLVGNFPQSDALTDNARIPKDFEYLKDTDDIRNLSNCFHKAIKNQTKQQEQVREAYKWLYKIPMTFYKSLHRQLFFLFAVSAFLLFIALIQPLEWFKLIGTAALVCWSFGIWLSIYLMLLYLDYRYKWLIPRFFHLILPITILILFSRWNNDHPIRYDESKLSVTTRQPLHESFESWLINYENNIHSYIDSTKTDTIKIPVFFICTEGGALRTGAYASLLLSAIQDSFPVFHKCIYCYSSVSGGTIGIGLFHSLSFLAQEDTNFKYQYNDSIFFRQDYLSPVLGKLLYGDFLNLFWPTNITYFNRENALEEGWELGFGNLKGNSDQPIWGDNFLSAMSRSPYKQAWFVNTTEVESGLQCWATNVLPDKSFTFCQERDLFNSNIKKLNPNLLNYSTIMSLSSRFPLISPAAAVECEGKKYHYIDGGYTENSGAGTMLEVMQSLRKKIDSVRTYTLDKSKKIKIVPYVIQLNFGDDSRDSAVHKITTSGNLNSANEITEIVSGIYNTRVGRTNTARSQLEYFTDSVLNGHYISFYLASKTDDVPTSWILSSRALGNIQKQVKSDFDKQLKVGKFGTLSLINRSLGKH